MSHLKFAQSDSDEKCDWYACKRAAEERDNENAVLVCRFAAGHFETPGAFVVSFAFVCAGCNHCDTADPGVVLSIVNSALAL